jgi:hypothetical protein
MITFHLFYAGDDGVKVVLNNRQHSAIAAVGSPYVYALVDRAFCCSHHWCAADGLGARQWCVLRAPRLSSLCQAMGGAGLQSCLYRGRNGQP